MATRAWLSIDDVAVGDEVRIVGTRHSGPIVKKYAQKIAIDCGGRIVEIYPAEVELVPAAGDTRGGGR